MRHPRTFRSSTSIVTMIGSCQVHEIGDRDWLAGHRRDEKDRSALRSKVAVPSRFASRVEMLSAALPSEATSVPIIVRARGSCREELQPWAPDPLCERSSKESSQQTARVPLCFLCKQAITSRTHLAWKVFVLGKFHEHAIHVIFVAGRR